MAKQTNGEQQMENVKISGDSPEAVAYALLQQVIAGDERSTVTIPWQPEKKWLLATYADCLDAIKNYQNVRTPQ